MRVEKTGHHPKGWLFCARVLAGVLHRGMEFEPRLVDEDVNSQGYAGSEACKRDGEREGWSIEGESVKLVLASVGNRSRRDAFDTLADLYMGRTQGYCDVETQILRSEEGLLEWLDRLKGRTAPVLLLLDGRGRALSSEEWAGWIGEQRDGGRQWVVVAIGPADGWSEGARKRADLLVSLGPMTLPHELARVVASEQIYRAFTILAGHPYHHGH